jgi:hypothetical protein
MLGYDLKVCEFFQYAQKCKQLENFWELPKKNFIVWSRVGINPLIEKQFGHYLNFFGHCSTNLVINISDWKKFDHHNW